MNKNDLVAKVAGQGGFSKVEAGKAVDATLDVIMDALRNRDDVRLVGFGTFSVSNRGASIGRNPRTGEEIKIPPMCTPKFRAGKGLRDAVNS